MNRTLSLLSVSLPFRKQLQAIKRAIIPYKSNPGNDLGLLYSATLMVAALKDAGADLGGKTVQEIGTGWIPILPLIFRCAGAGEVFTMDHDKLMDAHTFRHAISFIHENLTRGLEWSKAPREYFNLNHLPSRSHRSLQDLCRSANIVYGAPFDFLDAPPESADFIVTRAVLEHIPEETVQRIFAHAATVVRPGGMMCHMIDLSDHLEHHDKSLSRVDMLRYSDQEWRDRTRHRLNHLSRARRFDYVRMLEETGWEVISMTAEPNQKALQDLKTMPLVPRYANVPHEELAILDLLIVCQHK
ncbi:MAG TPA: methyltransferase domain-containing protein [Rhizomicrobium sp.]|nr:methyltransferase domain-containing protein [Rhizomicrobium sp.]